MRLDNLDTFQGKKILITGGLGFVGVNLVVKLLENGIKPEILDYIPKGESIETLFVPFKLTDVSFYNVDITDRKNMITTIKSIKPDFIIHLASMTDLTKDFEHAHKTVDINIRGTINLLEGIKDLRISNFLFLSSSDVYGNVEPPFQENQQIIPASPYSVSKISAEMYCLMFSRVYDFPVTILRGFNLFGKHQRPNRVIPFIILELLQNREVKLTEGKQKREFNFVDNLIDAIFLSLLNTNSQGQIINIGCGKSYSIREIALNIGKELKCVDKLLFGAIPYRPNEIWDMFCDNTKARKILKWEPRIPLEEGIEITLKWYQDNFPKGNES